mmetsp:Transcript_114824/g.357659  ORF Transcript_114824/g.357659 Transcript_114824/m.357659 type:complete len:566 (+) Transcript_114824:56-1753(+)
MVAKVMKKKRVLKGALRGALLADLKQGSGRRDIKFRSATKVASRSQDTTPIEERAGFPVRLKRGCVHPRDWATPHGVKIHVDFNRSPWLPDDWGQGVKITQPTVRSTMGGGGILTAFVAPDGKNFFHKATSEEYCGFPLTREVGWNGQLRTARIQAQQHVALVHAEGENGGLSKDESLFKLLSPRERKCLPSKDELHVCIVSARRATRLEGVRDIFMVEQQFRDAGLAPTWYVDDSSLKDYRALGLQAVVGGKLTPSRNKALADARRHKKVCVQVSDDISAWEYRDGANAKVRTDEAMNAAHAKARRLIVSPVAAARFIVAKMRGVEGPKPKLGGVYMLGSCSRTFLSDAFSRHHFILGDFFCAEPDSVVNFDNEMTLKEDYGFTCAHISKYGSVMRCNRMTLNVKHYDNGGGACSNRDKKGLEEQRNIEILKGRYPGCFQAHPKRKNEVILRWKGKAEVDEDEEGEAAPPVPAPRRGIKASCKAVKKHIAKRGRSPWIENSIIVRSGKSVRKPYIEQRVKQAAGKTAGKAFGLKYKDASGRTRKYGLADLRYDLACGYVTLKRR